MKTRTEPSACAALSILLVVSLSACASRSAPDINGRWRPLNGFAETTEAIPLHRSYMFYPSPTDGTLKTMLARWAKDSNLTLTYQHPNDFTLHMPVTQIRTSNLQQAASLLTRIYADQQVSITANQNEIVVKVSEPVVANRTLGGKETAVTK